MAHENRSEGGDSPSLEDLIDTAKAYAGGALLGVEIAAAWFSVHTKTEDPAKRKTGEKLKLPLEKGF